MNSILLILLFQLVIINCQNIQSIIINGLLVTGKESLEPYLGHILIGKNGKILNVLRETGKELNEIKEKYKDVEIIDAKDKIVIPGGVDAGVKFDYLEGIYDIESSDNFFTGSVAAVCGGTTTILDIIEPNLNERETFSEALKSKLDEAEHNSVIDYSFHMVINYIKNDILMIEKFIKKAIYKNGINSFRFDTYTKKPKLSKIEMNSIFKLLKKYGGLAVVNCGDENLIKENFSQCTEDEKSNPNFYSKVYTPDAERDSIEEILKIAKDVGFAQGIHISHISTESSMLLIREEKKNGFIATTEVTPHHLILTEDVYDGKNGIDYITSPPLRTKNDVEKLWKGLNEGIIDYVVSDHCPFTKEQKRGKRTKPDFRLFYNKDLSINKTYDTTSEKWSTKKSPEISEIPKGFGGIETRMILMYHYGVVEKRLNLQKFVQVTSTNAAKRFGIYPRKGLLERGSDADIVIIDPNEQTKLKVEKLHMNTNFCPYEDLTVNGKIKTVFSRGTKMVDNYQLLSNALIHKGNALRRLRYFLGGI